jgi:acyl carrier protein
MRKKKNPDRKQEIDEILIDELDIEPDSLTPTTKIEPQDDDDLLIEYILIRIEEQLEIKIPDQAASKIHSVHDVYNLIDTLQTK